MAGFQNILSFSLSLCAFFSSLAPLCQQCLKPTLGLGWCPVTLYVRHMVLVGRLQLKCGGTR